MWHRRTLGLASEYTSVVKGMSAEPQDVLWEAAGVSGMLADPSLMVSVSSSMASERDSLVMVVRGMATNAAMRHGGY